MGLEKIEISKKKFPLLTCNIFTCSKLLLDVAHQGVMWEKSSKEEKVSLGHDKQS